MKINKLIVKTNNKKYPILIGKNLLKNFSKILNKENIKFKKCLVVVDSKIPRKNLISLYKNLKKNKTIFYNYYSSEKNKNLLNVNKILEKLFKEKFNRNDAIISLGGGITGDVAGFVASIYKRGLKFINIPTTLLAQVDSSIGGKTGINNNYGKNLVGTFYQPDIVISDITILKSLPKREVICGYGEILKHSLIANKKNFFFLKKNKEKIINLESPIIEKAIFESCKIKSLIVEKDEKEKNLRKILNFGHTFAHAYEASLKFSKKLNHGEAVIIGIISAAKFSNFKNLLSEKEMYEIINHTKDFRLNIKNYFNLNDINRIIKYMKMDKKNKSLKINLILLSKIGKAKINLNFSSKIIKNFLKKELN